VRAPSLVASPLLLAELERALAYTKLRTRIHEDEATAVVGWIRRSATIAQDPAEAAPRASEDPGDDYLIALAAHERAALVSEDRHLLELAAELPIYAPAHCLTVLDR
jgi:predicted nucleic acid-binding protein